MSAQEALDPMRADLGDCPQQTAFQGQYDGKIKIALNIAERDLEDDCGHATDVRGNLGDDELGNALRETPGVHSDVAWAQWRAKQRQSTVVPAGSSDEPSASP